MQQALIGILLVLGFASYMLYTENQTLTNNNVKLEGALADQTAAIETLRESFERQSKSLLNMSRQNAIIEAEKAEYLSIFSRHNLDVLALKKPGLMENRFNGASDKVMEGLEDDTKELYNLSNPTINN